MHLQIICIFQNKCYYNKYQRNVNGKIQKLIFMIFTKSKGEKPVLRLFTRFITGVS